MKAFCQKLHTQPLSHIKQNFFEHMWVHLNPFCKELTKKNRKVLPKPVKSFTSTFLRKVWPHTYTITFLLILLFSLCFWKSYFWMLAFWSNFDRHTYYTIEFRYVYNFNIATLNWNWIRNDPTLILKTHGILQQQNLKSSKLSRSISNFKPII